MSEETRSIVANRAILQPQVNRYDLLHTPEEGGVDTNVIEVLEQLELHGWFFVITSLRHGHGDDSECGPDCHFFGKACDCWFLGSKAPDSYLKADSGAFENAIRYLASLPQVIQIGLGGSARNDMLYAAAGSKGFKDNDSDHIHFGV